MNTEHQEIEKNTTAQQLEEQFQLRLEDFLNNGNNNGSSGRFFSLESYKGDELLVDYTPKVEEAIFTAIRNVSAKVELYRSKEDGYLDPRDKVAIFDDFYLLTVNAKKYPDRTKDEFFVTVRRKTPDWLRLTKKPLEEYMSDAVIQEIRVSYKDNIALRNKHLIMTFKKGGIN